MSESTPNLVTSGLSRTVSREGVTVEVNIFRLESETEWTLEVVNQARTSIVWDDPFENDQLALAAFQAAVDEEGMTSFLDSATVIPFPSR